MDFSSFDKDYILALELLATWSPSRPGLAVGVGHLGFGLGTIAFAEFFEVLLKHFPCGIAFAITSGILLISSISSIAWISWPCEPRNFQTVQSEGNDAIEGQCEVISLKKLPFIQLFWYYVLAIFAGQTGFAFIPYFFDIGRSFGRSSSTVVRSYQLATACATVFRLVSGFLSDILKRNDGFYSIGSKNVTLLLFILQFLSYVFLIVFSRGLNYWGFVFCASAILMVFAGISVESAILARDIFSPLNASLIFGTGGSIAMGAGEVFFGKLMEYVDQRARSGSALPEKYNWFYITGIVFSIQGFVSSMILKIYTVPRNRIENKELYGSIDLALT